MQALLKKDQPLALFVHCTAHRLNLVVQDCIDKVRRLRDPIYEVSNLIRFFRDSPKRLDCLEKAGAQTSLRPLCQTRWTCTEPALASVLRNYDALRAALEDMAQDPLIRADTASTASSLHSRMENFDFFFGVSLARHLLLMTNPVMTAVQGEKNTVASNLELAKALRAAVCGQRDRFPEFWAQTLSEASRLDVDEPVLPRKKRAPRRLDDGAAPHHPVTPEEMYRPVYIEAVETLGGALERRYDPSADEDLLLSMERAVLTGDEEATNRVVETYDELDGDRLRLHLSMLHDVCKSRDLPLRTLADAVKALRMPCLADLVPEVTKVVRLHSVVPATSCAAERSFSQLRRLKSWLRATTSQTRLNHAAVCAVHAEILHRLDIKQLMREFATRSPHRVNVFGSM